MTRFIPREKMGKKARRQLDSQRRRTWPVPPVEKTFTSRKNYQRKRKSHDDQYDWNCGIFLYGCSPGMGNEAWDLRTVRRSKADGIETAESDGMKNSC